MELSLFDLHCDTAYEMYRQKQPLSCNGFAVSLENARKFKRYVQIMALWTDCKLTDEDGWDQALCMLKNLQDDPSVQNGTAPIVTSYANRKNDSATLLLGVEDARILAGDVRRVEELYRLGIRILTPLWKGSTCIGGSHDTLQGLTPFGKTALQQAAALGMILDISHASEQSAEDIFEISEEHSRPVIASHSDAYTVCPVSRNLRDRQLREILHSDGIIGINLYGAFLKADGNATAEDVLPHIEHFLELGAQNALCLGCDMDGCDLPPDIPNLAALPHLEEILLQHNYSEQLIRQLFFENADRFFIKHLS